MNNKKSAFTLIELSVVLVIIAIIVAAVISFSKTIIDNSKTKVSNDKINAIYEAVGTFIEKNYRLPCPASLVLAKDDENYGKENGTLGNCADSAGVYKSSAQNDIVYGMAPVKALGLSVDSGEDGFGNKIIYIIDKKLTIAEYPNLVDNNGFSFYENGNKLQIIEAASGNLVTKVALVIMSFGANNNGAFKANATVQNNKTSSDNYEQKNYLSNITDASGTSDGVANFGEVSPYSTLTSITYSNLNSDIFDDIILFKTRDNLFSDFDIKFLSVCDAHGSNNGGTDFSNAYYGQTSVSNVACLSNATITATKECAFGNVWLNREECP